MSWTTSNRRRGGPRATELARGISDVRSAGRLRVAVIAALVLLGAIVPIGARSAQTQEGSPNADGDEIFPGPVPRAECGDGSHPETAEQGRVSAEDVASGRAEEGYHCNATQIGHYGTTGGTRVWRYVDESGRECAYYDQGGTNPPGVFVLDMADPTRPARTAVLSTPAMLSPHESLSLHAGRGLLAAALGTALSGPGWLDVYDLREDCRKPTLRASIPFVGLGHEGNFSPDGNTFWASSSRGPIAAIDVSNPSLPRTIWVGVLGIGSAHGINISEDGTRAYVGDLGNEGGRNPHEQLTPGLTVLDVSEVQDRALLPEVRMIGHVTWPEVSLPHNGIPVSIEGHPFLVEFDELTSGSVGNFLAEYDPTDSVGAARVIDIADETRPRVISNIRLEVNMPANRAGDQQHDPGAQSGQGGGYVTHYCAVPHHEDPGIVACSFVLSGLRVFDIRDPHSPKEVAYFIPPRQPGGPEGTAMSGAAFVPERQEIWFNDRNYGFFVVRITNDAWPEACGSETPGAGSPRGSVPSGPICSEPGSRPDPSGRRRGPSA